MAKLELSRRAKRDLRKLDPAARRRVAKALSAIAGGVPPRNLDVKSLAGRAPWRRLRVGNYRAIYRQMDDGGYVIERIVHRRDLERAVDSLR